MSGDEERRTEIQLSDRADRRPDVSNTSDLDRSRTEESSIHSSAHQSTNDGTETVEDLVRSLPDESRTVETGSVAATLLGVPHVSVREFVYDHRLDSSVDPGETRPIVLLDVHNTGRRPLRWQANRMKILGDDDYTYSPSSLTLDPASLGPGCHTRQVEIEPGRRARVVTLVEALPPGVTVDEVIQTLVPRGGTQSQRLAFSL